MIDIPVYGYGYLSHLMLLTSLVQEYIPFARIIRKGNTYVIRFTFRQMLQEQRSILAFWRACNRYHFKPVARTIFGKVKEIRVCI